MKRIQIAPNATGKIYDVAIVGGGLAGLALSIQLARTDASVILFEKEQYPFHRLCGEYISLESWEFLQSLGVDLEAIDPPIITKLELSSPSGKLIKQALPLGGFGISRYFLDERLSQIASENGVELMQNCKVTDISFEEDKFRIVADNHSYDSRITAASFGKRSNIDVKWKRPFITNTENRLNNFIGIKYHVDGDFPADTIILHCFEQGYCGIVKIDDGQYNLCYLTTAAHLKNCGGDIEQMEKDVLSMNPRLAAALVHAKKIPGTKVTISQVSFDKKSCVEDHVLMLGDAAGMIAPLCGNGMSIALHSSKIAALAISDYLDQKLDRSALESTYSENWTKNFASRLRMGRMFQRLTASRVKTEMLLKFARMFPGIFKSFIRRTHGSSF